MDGDENMAEYILGVQIDTPTEEDHVLISLN